MCGHSFRLLNAALLYRLGGSLGGQSLRLSSIWTRRVSTFTSWLFVANLLSLPRRLLAGQGDEANRSHSIKSIRHFNSRRRKKFEGSNRSRGRGWFQPLPLGPLQEVSRARFSPLHPLTEGPRDNLWRDWPLEHGPCRMRPGKHTRNANM